MLLRTISKKLSIADNNNFFLVDSFEGLSEILEEDKPENINIYQSQKGDLKSNISNVENLFTDFDNVHILKGWIPEIFNILEPSNKYKFVHIDVDLYEPTLKSLEFFYPRLVEGGIIVCDDYNSKHFSGSKKAWDEFFSNKTFFSS